MKFKKNLPIEINLGELEGNASVLLAKTKSKFNKCQMSHECKEKKIKT